jgi:beta-glucosidase
VEFCNVRGPADGDENEAVMDNLAGVRLGGAEVHDPEELLESAVEVAKGADAVIAVVGLNGDWYGSIIDFCSELLLFVTDI